MSERSELRRRREERMENGVKNLKGARLFPKTFSNNGHGDSFLPTLHWTWELHSYKIIFLEEIEA